MYCTVIDIRGDYASVRYEDTGVISEVALAGISSIPFISCVMGYIEESSDKNTGKSIGTYGKTGTHPLFHCTSVFFRCVGGF